MPNTFEGTLANIPGYGGYLAKRKYDEQSQLGELEQAGGLMKLVELLRKQQQSQAYQQDLAGLGSNPTPEQYAQVGAKYSGPEGLMKYQELKQNNAAKLEQAKQNAEMIHEFKMSREATEAGRLAETERHNKVLEPIVQQLATIKGEQTQPPVVVPDTKSPSGFSYKTRDQALGGPAPAPMSASRLQAGMAIPTEHADLHGADYLTTLPTGLQNTVKKFANYEAPLNTLSTRTGEREAMLERIAQYDPTFDVKKYPARQKVVNDFTSGVTANNITALDQALNHMGTLSQLADALKNNDVRVVNLVVNNVRNQLGDPRITNYQTAQTAVGTELMRVFRQVNASEQETKDWMSKFPLTGSPAQMQGSLGIGAKLLAGRVNALNNRWNNGMDVTTGYPKIMSPEAKAVLDKMIGNTDAPATGAYSDAEKERRYQEWKAQQK